MKNIIKEILTKEILDDKKAYFFSVSDSTVSIGEDSANPSFLTDMIMIKNRGLEIDATDGKIQNKTGRIIDYMSGTISFQPNKLGGGVTLMYLWGERSLDGVTWTPNVGSLRSIELPNDGETFRTTVSILRDFKSNEYMRFRMYTAGQGGINFVPPTINANNSIIIGHSVIWQLMEN